MPAEKSGKINLNTDGSEAGKVIGHTGATGARIHTRGCVHGQNKKRLPENRMHSGRGTARVS